MNKKIDCYKRLLVITKNAGTKRFHFKLKRNKTINIHQGHLFRLYLTCQLKV